MKQTDMTPPKASTALRRVPAHGLMRERRLRRSAMQQCKMLSSELAAAKQEIRGLRSQLLETERRLAWLVNVQKIDRRAELLEIEINCKVPLREFEAYSRSVLHQVAEKVMEMLRAKISETRLKCLVNSPVTLAETPEARRVLCMFFMRWMDTFRTSPQKMTELRFLCDDYETGLRNLWESCLAALRAAGETVPAETVIKWVDATPPSDYKPINGMEQSGSSLGS